MGVRVKRPSVDYASIRSKIKQIAGTSQNVNVRLFDATIISVNRESRTCIVDSIDHSLDGIEVRYMVDISDGDCSIPSVDSTVTVAMTDFTDPYIVKSSWIDEKII